jgi:poly(3-hydroxybutyrate) depolymerase
MGGGIAYASARRAADLFAAIVSSSFDFYEDEQSTPARPISVLSFLGKSDPLTIYDGSVAAPGRFVGAKPKLEELVRINHCTGSPINIGSGCGKCTQCDQGVYEGLSSIENGGHLTGDLIISRDFLSRFEKR